MVMINMSQDKYSKTYLGFIRLVMQHNIYAIPSVQNILLALVAILDIIQLKRKAQTLRRTVHEYPC
jgi:hypothetical protein